ncbi:alpha/beta hydrolase [Falsirhodobacter sp. 1013]|uniref:alpha/beta hydrolase n=1 Tax=Falsirhodobacter sp. 1013 TaxID=3417566 RepID=UPI003EB8568D
MTNPFIRPDVAIFLKQLEAQAAASAGAPPSLDATRAGMEEKSRQADLPVGDLARIEDLTAKGPDSRAIALQLYDVRPQREASPLVVFYHGGGFVTGSLATHAAICAQISRLLDLPVVAVDYRLAPEHPWPAAPDDGEAATRHLAEARDLGFVVEGLFLCGDSAGGNLALVTALALKDRPAAVPVLGQCLFYPVADLKTTYPSEEAFGHGYLLTREFIQGMMLQYKPDVSDPRASPLFGSLEGLAPTAVVTAGVDPLRDQGRALVAALGKAGVPLAFHEARGLIHAFLNFRRAIPSASADLERGLALFRTLVAGSVPRPKR